MPLDAELAKQRIKAQIARGENRANVSDETIDRHAESYKQMLEDIKSEGITDYETTQPSTSISEFDLADKLTPIGQNFKDGTGGRKMQPQFKDKSTMDLIISGDRTRTTRAKTDIERMVKDYGLSKISDLVGKVIRMTDNTGRQVYTTITKVVPFTQEYQDATWQNEGWEKSVTDKHVGDYPYAIEFKVVDKPTQSPTSINPLVQAGVKPTDMAGNASKDIQMASESTQFIGFQSGNATVSSTNKYREAWGDKANTGKYTAKDTVMVSGSGLFRGVTEPQIKETLTNKYKPLLEQAVAAGASFRVGNQYAKGNLFDQLIAQYLKLKGYQEEVLPGYSRWTPQVAETQVQIQQNFNLKVGSKVEVNTSDTSFEVELKTFKQNNNSVELSFVNAYGVEIGYRGKVVNGVLYPTKSFNSRTGWRNLSTASYVDIPLVDIASNQAHNTPTQSDIDNLPEVDPC